MPWVQLEYCGASVIESGVGPLLVKECRRCLASPSLSSPLVVCFNATSQLFSAIFTTMHQSETTDRWTLVVFGDQTSNVSSVAKQLFQGVPQSAAATEFLRDASAALMAQRDRLRPFQRIDLPDFKNLHDMARIYEEAGGVCHPSITSVMLCATQLLQLFRSVVHSRALRTMVLRFTDISKSIDRGQTKTSTSLLSGCAPAPSRPRRLQLLTGSKISGG